MSSLVQQPLSEQRQLIKDDTGYALEMDKVSFNQIDLKWASYTNPQKKTLSFHPEKSSIVSHFRIQDAAGEYTESGQRLSEKQFLIYREPAEPYDLQLTATKNTTRTFFELNMSDDFFKQLFTDESDFLKRFRDNIFLQTPSFDFTADMLPAMYAIINDMKHPPYCGHLKVLYLEAKSIELFLLQVKQLDQRSSGSPIKLKPADVERLYAVKEYIDGHYDQPCSITGLARMAGINQMKLKNGFKELFHTTVFGYLSDVRMEEAKRLLLDEKLYVAEVADRIGFKHPQHFTTAFRKKFGMLPSALKTG